MPNPPLSHQELFSTSAPALYFAPGIETKRWDSENFGCVGSISLSLPSPGRGFTLLWQSQSSQETGISGVSRNRWGLLGVVAQCGVRRVQEVMDLIVGQHKEFSALLFLGKKGRKGFLLFLGKGELWHQLQRNLPGSEV